MKKTAKTISMILVFALILTVAGPLLPGRQLCAAVRKVKAVENYKKAKLVKPGTTKVSCAKANKETPFFLKFKAGKKGVYTFDFSNFRDGVKTVKPEDDINALGFAFLQKKGNAWKLKKIKTKKGKAEISDIIVTKQAYKLFVEAKEPDLVAKSTRVKMTLKKGQTIYIMAVSTGNRKYSFDLKIRK